MPSGDPALYEEKLVGLSILYIMSPWQKLMPGCRLHWSHMYQQMCEKQRTPVSQLNFKKRAEVNGMKYLLKESVLLSSLRNFGSDSLDLQPDSATYNL